MKVCEREQDAKDRTFKGPQGARRRSGKGVRKKSLREEIKTQPLSKAKARGMSNKTEVVPVLDVRKLCRIKTKKEMVMR